MTQGWESREGNSIFQTEVKNGPFFKDKPRGEGRFGTIWCHIRKRRIIKLLQNHYCNSLEIVFYSVNHYINFLLEKKKKSYCFGVSHYFLYSCIRTAANGTVHCKFWPNSESAIIQLLCSVIAAISPNEAALFALRSIWAQWYMAL